MGKLRERLDRYKEAREEIAADMEYGERFEKAIPRIEWFDGVIEGDNVMKQRRDAERQGIRRLFEIENECFEKTFGFIEKHEKEWMNEYDRLTKEDVEPMTTLEEIRQNQYKDVVENFLYAEWVEQMDTGLSTFSHFATLTALKAFVTFMTTHKNSDQALLEFVRVVPDDLRNRCIAFKDHERYDPTDTTWYVSTLLNMVPEAWEISQVFLTHYANQVRLEGSKTPLPDNPFKTASDDDERVRLRQAVHAYTADEGSVRELSKKYGVTRRVLEDELRTAGILKGRGGDRKG